MPRYQLAIFDFDGTLADSFDWFCSVVNQTADRFGFSRVADGEVEALRDLGVRAVMARLGVPAWKLPQISIYMRSLQAQNIDQIQLFPGAAQMLTDLHAAGIRLALVSSNAEANIRRVLGPAAELFGHYGCGSSLWGKPAKFRATLKATGVTASAAICLGDEVRDIEAARKVGTAAGSVTYGYNSAAALRAARPDHSFNHPSELVAALLD
ncbi:MAG: HAD-IA family hydrolase [Devosia sp.]